LVGGDILPVGDSAVLLLLLVVVYVVCYHLYPCVFFVICTLVFADSVSFELIVRVALLATYFFHLISQVDF